MSISKLTIGKKLALVCAGLMALSTCQTGIAVYAFSSVITSLRCLSTRSVPSAALNFAALGLWWTVAFGSLAFISGAFGAWLTIRNVNSTLRFSVSELTSCAERFVGAAGQVAAASQSLAQGASEQAASLEETAASSNQINSMARRSTENSSMAVNLMGSTQKNFDLTNRTLQEMVEAMSEISASSDKISKIIKVIDDIAFQTNILALNAAVEAARAGEAGMGFAVVADEVRNLSQRCAQAAKDTAALIQDSISRSNDGKRKVDQVSSAIRLITEESSRIRTLVQEINVGSQDQAKGIDQIGNALLQIEQVTQNNAANAEQSASAASELNAQAEALLHIVESISAVVQGSYIAAPEITAEVLVRAAPEVQPTSFETRQLDKAKQRVDRGITSLVSALEFHVPERQHPAPRVVQIPRLRSSSLSKRILKSSRVGQANAALSRA